MKVAKGTIAGLKEKDYTSLDVRIAGAIVIGTIPICTIGFFSSIFSSKMAVRSDHSP